MARVSGIVGAVVLGAGLSQFPEFSQQYEQRLGGAVDELRIIVAEFDRSATRAGLTREAALADYDGTEFLELRGQDMRATFVRLEKLEGDLVTLQNSTAAQKVANLPAMMDTRIAQRAWENYAPAVPINAEGGAFAVMGGVAGYAGIGGLFGLFGRLFGIRRRKTA